MLAFSKPCRTQFFCHAELNLLYSFANLKMCERDISLHPPPCLRIGWYKPHALSGSLRCFPPKHGMLTVDWFGVFRAACSLFILQYFSWNYVSLRKIQYFHSPLHSSASSISWCLRWTSLRYYMNSQMQRPPLSRIHGINNIGVLQLFLGLGAGSSATHCPAGFVFAS